MAKFIRIEQSEDEDGSGLITHFTARNFKKALEVSEKNLCYNNAFIVLSEDDFNAMCQAGAGG